MNKKTFTEKHTEPPAKMPATLKEWVRIQYEDDELRDIYTHGCINGVAGLTYYSDTCEIYEEYEGDVWELTVKQAEEFGSANVMEFIGTFNGAKNVYDNHTFKNLMVWYAVEEIARKIIEETKEESDDE